MQSDQQRTSLPRPLDERPSGNLGAPSAPVELPQSTDGVPPAKRAKLPSSTNTWSEQSRQWDIRINLAPGDSPVEDAEQELDHFKVLATTWSKVRYIYIGGIELGDNPAQDDFGYYHVHAALILHTPNTRRSVVHNLGLAEYKSGDSRSYYISVRNPFMSFSGWLKHHSKERTKVTKDYVALEFGDPPREYGSQLLERGKGKLKQDDMLRDIMELFSRGQKDKAFQEYPALTLRYHAQITALVKNRPTVRTEIDHSPRLWIYGPPGTGKSLYVAHRFPKCFKKSLAKREVEYWNGLDLDWHDHVYLEDVGPDAFAYIGMEQWKQWSDPSHGYTVSMKYGAPIYGVNLPLIVTSNYTPNELMAPDTRFMGTELGALLRRFEVVQIDDLLRREGLKLRPKEELKELKKARNADFGACFEEITPQKPLVRE